MKKILAVWAMLALAPSCAPALASSGLMPPPVDSPALDAALANRNIANPATAPAATAPTGVEVIPCLQSGVAKTCTAAGIAALSNVAALSTVTSLAPTDTLVTVQSGAGKQVLASYATGLALGVADPRLATSARAVRQVGNRVGIPNQISGGNVESESRVALVNYVPTSALKVCLANFYVSSTSSGMETVNAGTTTFHAQIEYPHGTFTELKFSGASTGTTTTAYACTDLTALGFTLPAFTPYRLAFHMSTSGAGRVVSSVWSNAAQPGNGDEYQISVATDHTGDDTVIGTAGQTATIMYPLLVLGQSDRQVSLQIGDSRLAGINDTMASASGGRGIIGRSLAKLGPSLNYGVPGDRATWQTTNLTNRVALAQLGGAGVAYLESGINDLTSGSRTSAQILADRTTIRGLLTGMSVYDLTIDPTSSSTDGFRTAANQSLTGSNATRITVNQALRGTPQTGSSGIIDITAMDETKPGFVGTASFATNVMTVTAVTQGKIEVGDQITATGITAGTQVTALGTGLGGTGTYTLSTTPGTVAAEAVTAPSNEVGVSVDGGVLVPLCAFGGDGVHTTSACAVRNEQVLDEQLAVKR